MEPIKPSLEDWFFGVGHLLTWMVLGIWALPKFERIFVELSEGSELPWLAIEFLRVGTGGCLLFALFGGLVIVGLGFLTRSLLAKRIVILLFGLTLVSGVFALFWPLRNLIDSLE